MDVAGSMYHTLVVMTNNGAQQGAGGRDNYTTLLTTRCALKGGDGSRSNDFLLIQSGSSYRIITRYQEALWSAASTSLRLDVDGIRYTVQSWKRIADKRKSFIEFSVTIDNA
jgi:hypothetical protein